TERTVTAHRVLTPLDRRDAVLPLGSELAALVVVRPDASDVGVDDVVVDSNVRNLDHARVLELPDLELVAVEDLVDRRSDTQILVKDELMMCQAVLLYCGCSHDGYPFLVTDTIASLTLL